MTYRDSSGRPIDTSEMWRMPSYQADAMLDSVRYNKPRQNTNPAFQSPGYGGQRSGSHGYGSYSSGPDIDLSGLLPILGTLFRLSVAFAKWFALGGGVSVFTALVYLGLAAVLVFERQDILMGLPPATEALMGACLIIALLGAGLAGLVRHINQTIIHGVEDRHTMELLGGALSHWVRTGVFFASPIMVVVATLIITHLLKDPDAYQEDIAFACVPLALALGHLALTRLMRRRYALPLGLIAGAAAGLYITHSIGLWAL
ncbi:MAG: hypothetical protein AAF213_13855 [Pseudomonadota bacterium]